MRFEKLPPIPVNFRGILAFCSSADFRLPPDKNFLLFVLITDYLFY
jgi:hypothetical protein